jgi:hypothetical protein
VRDTRIGVDSSDVIGSPLLHRHSAVKNVVALEPIAECMFRISLAASRQGKSLKSFRPQKEQSDRDTAFPLVGRPATESRSHRRPDLPGRRTSNAHTFG